MPKKVLALKITPQTYPVYMEYPGIVHLDLRDVNNTVFVRDEELPGGTGYFTKMDFDKFYRSLRSPMYFTKFTEVMRIPPHPDELDEVMPPKRVRE